MKTITLGLIAVLAATPAGAVMPTEPFEFNVYGDISCGMFVEDLGTPLLKLRDSIWLTGFVSGAGSAGIENRGLDGDNISLYVRQYCLAHPLKHAVHAVGDLLRTRCPGDLYCEKGPPNH